MAADPSNPPAHVFTSARIASVCSPSVDIQQSSQIRVRNVSLILFHLPVKKNPWPQMFVQRGDHCKVPLQMAEKAEISRAGRGGLDVRFTDSWNQQTHQGCLVDVNTLKPQEDGFLPACLYSVPEESRNWLCLLWSHSQHEGTTVHTPAGSDWRVKGQRGNSPVPPCPRSPQKPTCHPGERTTQVPSSLKAEPSNRGAWGSHGCQLSRIKVSVTAEKGQCEFGCHMNAHVELCLHNVPQRERWGLRAWGGSKPSSLLPPSAFQREHPTGLTAS